jgi:hypothetical protein
LARRHPALAESRLRKPRQAIGAGIARRAAAADLAANHDFFD